MSFYTFHLALFRHQKKSMNKMTMTKVGETDLRVTRRFNAPPQAVYDAHIDEAKIKQWMLGPEGWTMPGCSVDGREGGKFSYTWEDANSGERFTIFGTFLELDPPHRIYHEETMDMGDDTPPTRGSAVPKSGAKTPKGKEGGATGDMNPQPSS